MLLADTNRRHTRRQRRDRGAMLLAVLFMMAMLVLAALAVAPAFIQQAKRDREEEMIHRGTEYERAIKKFYKKFGRYPANLDQLDSTNQIRFLRRRYKDPLVKDGQWRLLRYGDIQAVLGGLGVAVAGAGGVPGGLQGGVPGANPLNPAAGVGTATSGSDQGTNPAPSAAQSSPQQQSGATADAGQGGTQTGGDSAAQPGGTAAPAGQSGLIAGQGTGQTGGAAGTPAASGTGQTGSNNSIFGSTGVGGQTFGGAAIVGVASKSKDPTIRVFNKKKTYDEWQFFYMPTLSLPNVLLSGPYNGPVFLGSQVGMPPQQLNQGGPQEGAPGVQLPPQNQQQNLQPNQPIAPVTQFPPDQTQPPPP